MSIRDLNTKKNVSGVFSEEHVTPMMHAQEKHKKRNFCQKLNSKLSEKDKTSGQQAVSRDGLIRQYIYLVNWVVNRLPVPSLKGMDKDDLIGYGTIGLIEAIDRFDPLKSSSFESFVVARIKGSIYDQLRASDWLTRGARKKVKGLFKVIHELENKLSRCPSDKEIAEELSVSLDELRKIQQEAQIGIYSLDEPKDSSEEHTSLVDSVSSNSITLLEEIEENELKERLTRAIDNLPEREKVVVGLYHFKNLTFKEIAEVMEFSESRASQIHARAISLLKSKMLKD